MLLISLSITFSGHNCVDFFVGAKNVYEDIENIEKIILNVRVVI